MDTYTVVDGLLTVSLPLYFPLWRVHMGMYVCVCMYLGKYNFEVHEVRDEFTFHEQFGFWTIYESGGSSSYVLSYFSLLLLPSLGFLLNPLLLLPFFLLFFFFILFLYISDNAMELETFEERRLFTVFMKW